MCNFGCSGLKRWIESGRNKPSTSLVLPWQKPHIIWKQAIPAILTRQTLTPVTRFPRWNQPGFICREGHTIQIQANYNSGELILPLSQGKPLSRWHCVLDKCSAKTKHSDQGNGLNRVPSALNSTRRPRPRSSPAWTLEKWFSCQREKTSMTGLRSTWWISLTGSTWFMARWASSAPSARVPSCLGGWSMSTGGKMGTTTRNPPSFLLWSTWICWWTGSSRSSITKTSSPPE